MKSDRMSYWSALMVAYVQFKIELFAYIVAAFILFLKFGPYGGVLAFAALVFIIKAVSIVFGSFICKCGESVLRSSKHCSRCGIKTPLEASLDKGND